MENKLTWVELKKAVARQTQLTEKEVGQILSIWLEEMTAALQRGEELRINGLGTFKIKTMKERKSVDVTTGEAIILPETDRLTFTMATSLEEELQDDKPTRLEAGIDPIQKLSKQADEIVGLLGELGQSPKTDLEDGIQPEPQPQPQPQPQRQPQPQPQPKKERLWLTAAITILVFIVLMVGAFFFFQHKLEQWLVDLRNKADMVEQVEPIVEPIEESVEQMEQVEQIDPVAEPEEQVEPTPMEEPEPEKTKAYTEFIAVEKMHKDSRLTWMAYRYYGKKDLWVFIYDANRDHISNPQHIVIGTPIRIPKLDPETLQLASPELRARVEQMKEEFLGDR